MPCRHLWTLITNYGRKSKKPQAKTKKSSKNMNNVEIDQDISKNAWGISKTMLIVCVISWLRIVTTTDVELITNANTLPLPLIDINIPIALFYICVPFLLFLLFLKILLPPILKYKEIWSSTNRFDENIIISIAIWLVPITIIGFWIRYIPRHDWAGTIIHIILLILAFSAVIIFYSRYFKFITGKEQQIMRCKNLLYSQALQVIAVVMITLILILFSLGSINGTRNKGIPKLFAYFGYDVFANLREQDIAKRPDNYFQIDPERRDSSIISVDLKKCDLRQADAAGAFLVNVDLREANLQGANLRLAKLQNARLSGAILNNADFTGANLEYANLSGVELCEACFRSANMEGVKLTGFNIYIVDIDRITVFENTNLKRANITHNNLRNIDFNGAKFNGADLRYTNINQGQLDKTCGDSLTMLPDGLKIIPCEECR